jgi:L-lysine exporter family protein LysE/ArgO
MLLDATTGLLAGFTLIIAIGAQNAFVLRQGIRREHVGPVALLCALADALLIGAGVLGIGTVVEQAPVALDVVKWGGVAFLLGYAALALRRAVHTEVLWAGESRSGVSVKAALTTAAALTFLNPHVYLDTVLLLGSIANQHGVAGQLRVVLRSGLRRPPARTPVRPADGVARARRADRCRDDPDRAQPGAGLTLPRG